MHGDAIAPLALSRAVKHMAEIRTFLPGVPSAWRGLHSRSLTFRMPFPHEAAPRRYADDLKEFPSSLAQSGRPAERR